MIPFLLLFLGTMGLSLWASMRVKSVYRRHLQTPVANGMTGAQAAALILQRAGISDVQIYEHQEMLGDHYDPMNKRLVLSSDNYHGRSASAVGVAAHEAGHAIQHKQAYAPLHWRMAAVGVTTFVSQFGIWIPIMGLATGLITGYTATLLLGLVYGVMMLFNLVTLPVEFDATRRAKLVLNELGIVRTQEEASAVSAVLGAAAWTYVAAFITSLAYMLWHLLPLLVGGRSSDE
jgi:hypothetical protein